MIELMQLARNSLDHRQLHVKTCGRRMYDIIQKAWLNIGTVCFTEKSEEQDRLNGSRLDGLKVLSATSNFE